MRIAVSGTHCIGKTTLIEAFLLRHRDFAYEVEPYAVLQELYGEDFAEEPTVEDFQRQLEWSLETVSRYAARDRVIFERSPVDFLAYMLAIGDAERARSGSRQMRPSIDRVREAVSLLDAIVFLPLNGARHIVVPESENPRLREAVDGHLNDILLADELDLFSAGGPLIVEANGSVEQRLSVLERMLSRPGVET